MTIVGSYPPAYVDAIHGTLADGGAPWEPEGGGVVVPLEDQIIAEFTAAGWTTYGLFLARPGDVTLVSTKVSVWTNLGTGSDATQGTDATRPVYNTGGTGTGDSLTFAGSQDIVTGAIDASSDSAFTLTVLFSDSIATIRYTAEFGNGSTGQGVLGPAVNLATDQLWGQARTTTVSRVNSAASYDMVSPGVVTLTWDSALSSAETKIRHNGSDASAANSLDGDNAAPSINDTLTIGGRFDGTNRIVGEIAAVVLAGGTTSIPTTQLATVEALLQAEWGV